MVCWFFLYLTTAKHYITGQRASRPRPHTDVGHVIPCDECGLNVLKFVLQLRKKLLKNLNQETDTMGIELGPAS